MNVNLNNNFRIISDPLNFILQEKKTVEKGKKAGQETWVTIGYYGNLQSTLKSYIQKDIKKSDIESIENLIQRMNELEEIVKKVKKND